MGNERKQLLAHNDIKEVITSDQAIELDRFTTASMGIQEQLLMENAGCAVANLIEKLTAKEVTNRDFAVMVFCGPGNNGADAIVAARHLVALGQRCDIYFACDEPKWSPSLTQQVALLKKAAEALGPSHQTVSFFPPSAISSLRAATNEDSIIVIDGIFGAGLNRSPTAGPLLAIELINNLRSNPKHFCIVVSVDIPSGLLLEAQPPLGQCVIADYTVTFGPLKRAHVSEPSKDFCGKVLSANIGQFRPFFISNHWIFRQHTLRELLTPISKNCHKGSFGHVLVFEGHPNYIGASRLCARAALRAGVGLVTIATNHKEPPLGMDLAEFMHCPHGEIDEKLLRKIDALVIGPGLSRHSQWQDGARHFINQLNTHVPLIVFDADALPLLSSLSMSKKTIVATPHAHEAANLLSTNVSEVEHDRFAAIERLAKLPIGHGDNEVIWVLKGASTLVRAQDGEIYVFRGDLPVLAAAGSGDVLSGAIAGLNKQAMSPLAAVLVAVSMQIQGAKTLSKRILKGSLASELADLFPVLLKR